MSTRKTTSPAAKAAPKRKPVSKAGSKPAAQKAQASKAAPKAAASPKPKAVSLTAPRAAAEFRQIGSGGLGHAGAARAQAMAWFQDRLFVGTACYTPKTEDDRARIMTYDPDSSDWQTVFESPLADLKGRQQALLARLDPERGGGGRRLVQTGGARMGHDFAITAMEVFKGRSDKAPCLYCGTASIGGGLVLRSEDGTEFEPVSLPGIDNDNQMAVASMVAVKGRLFAAPMGTLNTHEARRHVAPANVLYYSDDPGAGEWHQLAPPGFDDEGSTGVASLAVAHDHLYVGISNPLSGYQIWRLPVADAVGKAVADASWEQILQKGAWRFNHNLSPVSMCAFGGALYIGSGLPGMGFDRDHDVGPAAAELIRLSADGQWDLLMGEPRFTPDGFKVPLSAKGTGFGDPCNGAISTLVVHADTLFAGTSNWRSMDWAMGDGQGPLEGGFQLWSSSDGETWSQVIGDGHGQPGATGLPAVCAAPTGLFLGTASQGQTILQHAMGHSGMGLAALDVGEGFDVLYAGPLD